MYHNFCHDYDVSDCLLLLYESIITAHPWRDGHFTSISVCGVWRARFGVHVFRRELHTHINLD